MVISWLDDHDAYHAERWYDPDEFDANDADAIARLRGCPGTEEGVFASLDVVEAAMGQGLPADVRARLERESAGNPSSCREEWGVAFACEVAHLLADGTIVSNVGAGLGGGPARPQVGPSIAVDRHPT